jgi:exonuclease III
MALGLVYLIRLVILIRALGWNFRGICNVATVRALRELLKGHAPDIIFLCETKVDEARMEKINKKSLGFSKMFAIGPTGRT